MALAAADGGDPFDAVLLLGFGGPEGPDDVVPFLENVTRGRGIPRERLVEVGAHYAHFGGVSPINEQNRALRAALAAGLTTAGVDLPVYWGNRNWHPMLADTVREMRDDGVGRAIVLLTSAYSSYSGCRQYRENLADAAERVGAEGAGAPPRFERVRQYYDQPGFLEPMADAVAAALDALTTADGAAAARGAALVFTTHSVPVASAAASGPPGWFDPAAGGAYVAQQRWVQEWITAEVARRTGVEHASSLVYQSRSGPPGQPWLEPDVSVRLAELAADGASGAVLVPIGFVSDHVEVLWDLDVVATADAASLGLPVARAATVGVDPRFVAMLVGLVTERADGDRPSLAPWGPMPDRCAAGCCPSPRGPRPALCGEDEA